MQTPSHNTSRSRKSLLDLLQITTPERLSSPSASQEFENQPFLNSIEVATDSMVDDRVLKGIHQLDNDSNSTNSLVLRSETFYDEFPNNQLVNKLRYQKTSNVFRSVNIAPELDKSGSPKNVIYRNITIDERVASLHVDLENDKVNGDEAKKGHYKSDEEEKLKNNNEIVDGLNECVEKTVACPKNNDENFPVGIPNQKVNTDSNKNKNIEVEQELAKISNKNKLKKCKILREKNVISQIELEQIVNSGKENILKKNETKVVRSYKKARELSQSIIDSCGITTTIEENVTCSTSLHILEKVAKDVNSEHNTTITHLNKRKGSLNDAKNAEEDICNLSPKEFQSCVLSQSNEKLDNSVINNPSVPLQQSVVNYKEIPVRKQRSKQIGILLQNVKQSDGDLIPLVETNHSNNVSQDLVEPEMEVNMEDDVTEKLKNPNNLIKSSKNNDEKRIAGEFLSQQNQKIDIIAKQQSLNDEQDTIQKPIENEKKLTSEGLRKLSQNTTGSYSTIAEMEQINMTEKTKKRKRLRKKCSANYESLAISNMALTSENNVEKVSEDFPSLSQSLQIGKDDLDKPSKNKLIGSTKFSSEECEQNENISILPTQPKSICPMLVQTISLEAPLGKEKELCEAKIIDKDKASTEKLNIRQVEKQSQDINEVEYNVDQRHVDNNLQEEKLNIEGNSAKQSKNRKLNDLKNTKDSNIDVLCLPENEPEMFCNRKLRKSSIKLPSSSEEEQSSEDIIESTPPVFMPRQIRKKINGETLIEKLASTIPLSKDQSTITVDSKTSNIDAIRSTKMSYEVILSDDDLLSTPPKRRCTPPKPDFSVLEDSVKASFDPQHKPLIRYMNSLWNQCKENPKKSERPHEERDQRELLQTPKFKKPILRTKRRLYNDSYNQISLPEQKRVNKRTSKVNKRKREQDENNNVGNDAEKVMERTLELSKVKDSSKNKDIEEKKNTFNSASRFEETSDDDDSICVYEKITVEALVHDVPLHLREKKDYAVAKPRKRKEIRLVQKAKKLTPEKYDIIEYADNTANKSKRQSKNNQKGNQKTAPYREIESVICRNVDQGNTTNCKQQEKTLTEKTPAFSNSVSEVNNCQKSEETLTRKEPINEEVDKKNSDIHKQSTTQGGKESINEVMGKENFDTHKQPTNRQTKRHTNSKTGTIQPKVVITRRSQIGHKSTNQDLYSINRLMHNLAKLMKICESMKHQSRVFCTLNNSSRINAGAGRNDCTQFSPTLPTFEDISGENNPFDIDESTNENVNKRSKINILQNITIQTPYSGREYNKLDKTANIKQIFSKFATYITRTVNALDTLTPKSDEYMEYNRFLINLKKAAVLKDFH